MIFDDRSHAGLALAEVLVQLDLDRDGVGPVVLGLPRGGVPVAYEIATALAAPLDVLVVRKLGVPGHEELALGAIASAGPETGDQPIRVLNPDVVASLGLDEDLIDRVAARERVELERRERLYRGQREPVSVADRTVIVVDDGLATGATMRAAVQAIRQRRPGSVMVAVPVGAASSCESVARLADQLVCLAQPEPFYGVGLWYRVFDQTSDDEVRRLLDARDQQLHDPARADQVHDDASP